MAKHRSPNYPGMTLEKAIAKANAVYAKEHTHAAPKDVIAEHLGYTSLNGSSLTVIGALNHYGLLEPSGDGWRVSDDAVAILELPAGDPEYVAALRRCAFRPTLFAELEQQFGDKLPSEANLRHALIKQGFLPKAADEVIRVYRENLSSFDGFEKRYTSDEEDAMERNGPAHLNTAPPPPRSAVKPETEQGMRQDIFSLPEGHVTIQWPASLSNDSFHDVADWLEIVKRKIGRSVADSLQLRDSVQAKISQQ
jgi:hypothetical protein